MNIQNIPPEMLKEIANNVVNADIQNLSPADRDAKIQEISNQFVNEHRDELAELKHSQSETLSDQDLESVAGGGLSDAISDFWDDIEPAIVPDIQQGVNDAIDVVGALWDLL